MSVEKIIDENVSEESECLFRNEQYNVCNLIPEGQEYKNTCPYQSNIYRIFKNPHNDKQYILYWRCAKP